MKQSGRVSIFALACIVSVALVLGLLLFSRESISAVGNKFMVALQSHDVDQLTRMSLMNGDSPDEVHKQWDFAVNKAGKYYRFAYRIVATNQASDSTGSVRMMVVRDADHPGAYEEAFELQLLKVNGEWKVDVRAISREMFPGLPN